MKLTAIDRFKMRFIIKWNKDFKPYPNFGEKLPGLVYKDTQFFLVDWDTNPTIFFEYDNVGKIGSKESHTIGFFYWIIGAFRGIQYVKTL